MFFNDTLHHGSRFMHKLLIACDITFFSSGISFAGLTNYFSNDFQAAELPPSLPQDKSSFAVF